VLGTETAPIHEYPHTYGNRCVVGGFVYRGAAHPDLAGQYVFGDYMSGRVWTLETEAKDDVPVRRELLRLRGVQNLTAFGTDLDGTIFVCVKGGRPGEGRVVRVVPAEKRADGPEIPAKLSATGVFADLATLAPAAGVYPYDVNHAFWSDDAHKTRWIGVPGDGTSRSTMEDRIVFEADNPWGFPAGTVLVKHFEMALDERKPDERRRLETRLLVITEGVPYGVTYKWNEEGTEAYLLDDALDETLSIRGPDGATREQVWHYPSRGDCMVCHNHSANYVLGVNARQLHKEVRFEETGRRDNQLRAFNRIGLFTIDRDSPTPIDEDDLGRIRHLAALDDESASLEDRARSYLDANCAFCHRPNGVRAQFDAQFRTAMADKHLVGAAAHTTEHRFRTLRLVEPGRADDSLLYRRMESLESNVQMPPLARNVPDRRGLDLLRRWIESLEPGR